MQTGLNLEFARSENLSLDDALRRAAEVGYAFVEPYVYAPVVLPINSHLQLQTISGYHHINAETTDLASLNRLRRTLGLGFSALDAHASLLMPPVGVPYLRRAIEVAAETECPVVMSDEGPVPEQWLPADKAFDVMCVSLEAIVPYAQSHGVRFAVELHNALTTQPAALQELLRRFGPAELGVNFDTGNCFLAGNDPTAFLEPIASRVVHVHVKDIPAEQLSLRGKVTGTRVGVAAGDGEVDLAAIQRILRRAGYDGVLSVECDTLAQARRSLEFFRRVLAEHASTLEKTPS